MQLTVFCQANAAQSTQPGAKSKNVRFVAIPGAQGPNAASFVNGMGNGFVELQNVTDDVAANFEAGQSYTVTIAPVTATPTV